MVIDAKDRNALITRIEARLAGDRQTQLRAWLGDDANALPILPVARDQAISLLQLCQDRGPGYLLAFLDQVFGAQASGPAALTDLKSIRQKLEAAVTAQNALQPDDDPYRAYRLRQGPLFLDRDGERALIEELAEGAFRVLVVNGGPRSGKSHCGLFLSHLAEARVAGAVRLIRVRALSADLAGFGPDRLAESIAEQIKANSQAPAADAAREPRWIEKLERWVFLQLEGLATCWIVLDGFGPSPLKPTHDLIRRLAERVAAGGLPFECRLILLNYDTQLLLETECFFREARLGPIMEQHLEAYFRAVTARLPEEKQKVVIPGAVKAVLEKLPPEGDLDRLPRLSRAVEEVTRELVRPNP